MPKYKYISFAAVIGGFMALLILCIIMTYPRYQKSIEQLPELIETDASSANPALLQIRQKLDEVSEQEDMVWTGSVCASKYRTLGGSERIYYVCPYIVAQTGELSTEEPSDWSLSLRFAVSALRDGEITAPDTNIQVTDIRFDFRVGENALISSVGYGDGEMNEVNGPTVSYQFRDREKADQETNLFTRLTLLASEASEAAEDEKVPRDEETAVANWSFVIKEKSHVIGLFDDVQIELPYRFSK